MVITGLIRPPTEIRAVVDTTAKFIVQKGRALEARIINSAQGKTPKFAFLNPASPFHAYYEDRVRFYEQGGQDGDDNERSDAERKKSELKPQETAQSEELVRKKEKSIRASAQDPVAKALLTQRAKLAQANEATMSSTASVETAESERQQLATTVEPPPATQYINILAPSNLTPAQIETMQLVAQFAALDGKNGPFLQMLALKEWHNPIFGFLQPRHGHFAYFSALVDGYRRILGIWTKFTPVSGVGFDRLVDTIADDVNACLEFAAFRSEYDRNAAQREMQLNDEASVAQIDWHDFVVVETINFPSHEIVLPPPPPPPPKLVVSTAIPSTKPTPRPVLTVKDDMDESDEEGEKIRVVPTYTPKVVSTETLVKDQTHVIDPITGKSVPVADMPEHMRIQLLDPKWAEERRKFQEKQKDSNLVSGDLIASNLSRLAQASGIVKSDDDPKKDRHGANSQSQTQRGASSDFAVAVTGNPNVTLAPFSQLDQGSGFEPLAKRPRFDDSHVLPSTAFAPPPPASGSSQPMLAPVPAFNVPLPSPLAQAAVVPPPSSTEGPSEFDVTGSESQLLPEAEFVATLSKPDVTLQIRVPNDPSQMAWNFYGQIFSLSVNVMSKVKEVKEQLSTTHLNGMPANKIQLKSVLAGAFLKDNLSLAQLNIGPTATLELVPKVRGGRK